MVFGFTGRISMLPRFYGFDDGIASRSLSAIKTCRDRTANQADAFQFRESLVDF